MIRQKVNPHPLFLLPYSPICPPSIQRFFLLKNGAKMQPDTQGEIPAVADILISLINSDKEKDKELFYQMMDLPNILDFVNLKDRSGTTALHAACQKNLPDKVHLLIKNGAMKMANSKNEMPAVADIMISLVNSDKEEDNELFGQMMDLPNIPDFVNLKDRNGTTTFPCW